MSALPMGWVETQFSDVFDVKGGTQPPKSEFSSVQRPNDIRLLQIRDFGSDAKAVYIPNSDKWSKCDVEDILIGRYGASVGKILTGKAGAYNVALVRVIFNKTAVDPRWVYNFLKTDHFQNPIALLSRSAQNGFNKEDLAGIPLQLPPLPEQQRIVAKVDALMTRTARARKDLAHIPTLITRYKQRLLALAFSGELIGNQPVLKHNDDPKCWSIPSNWKWTRFDEVAEVASNLVAPSTIPNLPHIAPDNIQSGTGRLLPYRTISEDKLISAKNRFYPGQVLYSKIRPYLKKAVIVDFDGACSADMYPINARSNLNPIFLLYWLISDDFAQFSAMHEGRTVLPKINQKALNGTPFPLPPLPEQAEIVRRIETAFAWLDRLAAEHTSATKLLPKLDAAILTKAFAGHLVPQNPTDEPAAVLLERVKAERDAMPKQGRGRKVAA